MNQPHDAAKPTERTSLHRHPERGRHDRATIDAILDEALYCHVGFVSNGQPFVIPTIHVRVNDRLFIHGSPGSRMMHCLREGSTACITVTLLDGLVLARSVFHHSMNYRSVVVFASAVEVTDPEEKLVVFNALTQHIAPGRWNDARQPNDAEIKATAVLAFPLNESSAKIRVGPPIDTKDDHALDVWAGVLPLSIQPGQPVADPQLRSEISVPDYVLNYRRPLVDD